MRKAMSLSRSETTELWKGFEARVMILLSLCLQIILILFGPQRKYLKSYWIYLFVWLAYLAANLVATTALGLLANVVGSEYKSLTEIQAFWAPFLLLHLGGPDSISAFSLEDNELWLRHLLGLIFQVGVAFYVFFSCWSNNALTFITIPMFIIGIIKYGERTYVLWSSSVKQLTDFLLGPPNPGSNQFGATSEMNLESTTNNSLTNYVISNNDLVVADFLFKRLKYLYAGLTLSSHERKCTYNVIPKNSAEKAFELIAIELGFMYDELYTKTSIIYTRLGIILRCICLFSHICISVFFPTMIHKSVYPSVDIFITYALIFGAIALEAYAVIILAFSDRTKLWMIRNSYIDGDKCNLHSSNVVDFRGLCWRNSKKWSRSMGQYNLLSFCLKDVSTKCSGLQKSLGIKEELEKYWNLTREDVDDDLQKLIFDQLRKIIEELVENSFNVDRCKEILAQRGDNCPEQLRWSTMEVDFHHSLLLWHIATDLCYHIDFDEYDTDANEFPSTCKISKCLSDYMLYLLVVCPTMLPKRIGDISYIKRYKDTCAQTMSFFIGMKFGKSTNKKDACQELLEISTNNLIETMKKDNCQSVLFHGCKLAKELQALELAENGSREEKWKIITEVWMEILEYAASRCEWKEHGQHLMQGGEFLTHLCVLMAHFGLSEQYQIEAQEIPLPT